MWSIDWIGRWRKLASVTISLLTVQASTIAHICTTHTHLGYASLMRECVGMWLSFGSSAGEIENQIWYEKKKEKESVCNNRVSLWRVIKPGNPPEPSGFLHTDCGTCPVPLVVFIIWGPPAPDKIWPRLLPDRGWGILSLRRALSQTNEWRLSSWNRTWAEAEGKNVRSGMKGERERERDHGCSQAWAEVSKHGGENTQV